MLNLSLKEIKDDSDLKKTPIAVLTTWEVKIYMACCLDLDVNLFITKSLIFSDLVDVMSSLGEELL